MSAILDYYLGTGTDGRGRTLAEVQALGHDRMEYYHDFIQWMFPLREPSLYNPDAPTLTDTDVRAFHDDPALRENLRRSFLAFLDFLGLAFDAEGKRVGEAPGREGRARRRVFAMPNHNWLRITRVLLCLKTLGLDDESRAFFAYLGEVHAQGVGISDDTFAYWEAASRGIAR